VTAASDRRPARRRPAARNVPREDDQSAARPPPRQAGLVDPAGPRVTTRPASVENLPAATTCAAGRDPARCCVGDPWADVTPYDTEPLDQAVIETAAVQGVDPHALDGHVTTVHGWESHDVGYDRAVLAAAGCLKRGTCG
jgi:hypothetical protein